MNHAAVRFDPTRPFVLLDDARADAARLFAEPDAVVAAHAPDEVRPALAALRQATRDGRFAAGFIGFEAGYALEPCLRPRFRAPADGLPLLWFGLFDAPRTLGGDDLRALLGDRRAEIGSVAPRLGETAHHEAVAKVQALIAAGDIYQANLTFPADIAAAGHPLGIYAHLRAAARAPRGALVHTGSAWALSFSPELFFTLRDGRLTTRPMKGTARRAPAPAADRAAAEALAADPKNRAENLMIVDLLRNDLSRVAAPGSVEVPRLFEVETYPTIHQMTSTVEASLREGADAVDAIEALFPCGSVTGAPKIRAMEVIAEVEPAPRGLYTGSIGMLDPGGDASFNVAIRTLVLHEGRASLGLGSGIVADSEPGAEWAECLAKAAFLTRRSGPFDLIETLRFEPGAGLARLDRHLARLRSSAAHWSFAFDEPAIRAALADAVADLAAPARIRLVLARSGNVAVQSAPLPPAPVEPVLVALAPLPVAPDDPRLAHKTSDRVFYDDARRASGAFEVAFVRPDGRLTEGSFTNLFVPRDGRLATPRLAHGLLPGVLREELLAAGEAFEADLRTPDLAAGFLVGNSLRGLLRAELAPPLPQQTPVIPAKAGTQPW